VLAMPSVIANVSFFFESSSLPGVAGALIPLAIMILDMLIGSEQGWQTTSSATPAVIATERP
jgi:hypothetical protein